MQEWLDVSKDCLFLVLLCEFKAYLGQWCTIASCFFNLKTEITLKDDFGCQPITNDPAFGEAGHYEYSDYSGCQLPSAYFLLPSIPIIRGRST